VQFHPEVIHTPSGRQMLDNFIFTICGCHGLWTMKSFIDRNVEEIRKLVGDEKVICGLSGGVDSSVVALLLHKAIGDQLVCVFVNNGVLRKGEAEEVQQLFGEKLKLNLRYVDASERFLSQLDGVTDPEAKRKIIGNEFIRVFEDEAGKLGKIRFLAQGTLYPDVIESVSFKGPSAVIKSHHNVGGLPERMQMELIEPLRELFKDEGREVGRELGLPEQLIKRQPFPSLYFHYMIFTNKTGAISVTLQYSRQCIFIVRSNIRVPLHNCLPVMFCFFFKLFILSTASINTC